MGEGGRKVETNNKVLAFLWKIEDIVLMTCLSIMGIALFVQVVCRYLFNAPLVWSEELARYLHVWITFLGLGYGIRNKSHIEMQFLYNKMSPTFQMITSIVTNLFLIFCLVYYIPGAMRFLADQNLINSSAMGIKMSIVYFVLPFGAVVSILYLAADVYFKSKDLFSRKERDISC